MIASQKSLIIGSSLLVGGSASAVGGYKYSEVTVEETLKGKILTEEATEAWKLLKTKLKAVDENTALSTELKTIKSDSDDEGNSLKEWCKSNYKTILEENKELIKEVENYCGYTFGIKLEDSKRVKTLDEAKTKIDTLKTTENLKNKALQDIKTKAAGSKEDEAKSELLDFCKSKYDEQYQGVNRDEIIKWCDKTQS